MTVGIVGGGLAGLSAALRLADHGMAVQLFEARRTLGGRAGAWHCPDSDVWFDHCQHVSMGCCTNFADLMQRAELRAYFQRSTQLHFIDKQGRHSELVAARGWPAPLHLAPALWRLRFLSVADRLQLAWTLVALARTRPVDGAGSSIASWLRARHVSENAICRFWTPVLVSALSEGLDRIDTSAARQVLVEGFMASSAAFHIEVPRVSLGELYNQRLRQSLERRGVRITCGARVQQLLVENGAVCGIQMQGGESHRFETVILAVPWRQCLGVIPDTLHSQLDPLPRQIPQFGSGAIAAVHVWFDRPIMALPHAVLLERFSQWIFARGEQPVPRGASMGRRGFYYQIVISALHRESSDAAEMASRVLNELRDLWPAARQAEVLCSQVISQSHAVFAPTPGSAALRPDAQTRIANLVLAGDWIRTGWPATMEGAVRSGYLAAEAVLRRAERPATLVVPPLPTSWLLRWVTRGVTP